MKSTRQNTTSHVTVKQYMEEHVHSQSDTKMQQVVGAPKIKKKKTKNDYEVQGENKEKMVSKVSKESPNAV